MRSAASLLLFVACAPGVLGGPVNYSVIGDEPGAWKRVLESVGLRAGTPATLFVVRSGIRADGDWRQRIEAGAFAVLEGDSPVAESLGFRATGERIAARNIIDLRDPRLEIIWEQTAAIPAVQLPAGARVFAKERWSGAPVLAGLRLGRGAVLWVAASPGQRGFERYPYLLQALCDLGLDPGVTSRRLWAFFDSSYRLRVDVDHFAERWRKAGISALHVAAWHYHEPDRERDEYLQKLIAACHRKAIAVYAWLELPHVSEQFWNDHPEWREKTATLQDAHLDWRKLMNLQNSDCRAAILRSTQALIERFDWDGVNLGELYFESLEGAANPARFTPFNDDVRRAFRDRYGADPVDVVMQGDRARLAQFLAFRADLVREMQEGWIGALDGIRRESKRDLDVVLTHVDDRFDTRMRDFIGADAARVLPLLDKHHFTFLIEDPATVWHLGPERYPQIAAKYRPLVSDRKRLGIDINIVERYQEVYPTKQQTGSELFQLVHLAASAFERVALYFESSLSTHDWKLLPAAAAVVERFEQAGGKLLVENPAPAGVSWRGPALVNGVPWPFADAETVWLPAGAHVVEPGPASPGIRILDFNGELLSVSVSGSTVEFSYESQSRAFAVLDASPAALEIDGNAVQPVMLPGNVLVLPRGQHIVSLRAPLS